MSAFGLSASGAKRCGGCALTSVELGFTVNLDNADNLALSDLGSAQRR
jgi:hypothetical protein